VIVDCAVYRNGERRLGELALTDACEASQEEDAFVWIDLYEPTPEEFGALREEFGLHPLAVEDAIVAHERPKLERYGDIAFLVLRTACYDDDREEVGFGEILLFAGASFVITTRHGQATDITAARKRLEAEPDTLRKGTAAAVYVVVDQVVDGYEGVVQGLQTDIDEVEESLFGSNGADPTKRIYKLGREVLELSRSVTPLVDPVSDLAEGADLPGRRVDDEVRAYFRDVLDHVVKYDQWVSAQRELLSNLLQANLTQVTIAQNADMRRISAWVAIVAVPTAIAGIYGMNFEHMPELKWTFGYPLALGVMATICAALYWRFKRAGWL
jgi:magnesium transporter